MMAAKHSEFKKYLKENGTLPADCTLGNLAWFTVADAPYDADAMAKEFDRLQLNSAMLPAPLRADDAFEKATKKLEHFKYTVLGGHTAEILIREVTRDSRIIARQLIREIKDSRGQRLQYDKVGELVFYKGVVKDGVVDQSSARVRSNLEASVSPSEQQVLAPLLAEFNSEYDRFRTFHDGQKIRGVLRNYLDYLNAVQLKPSVYFVHNSRSVELEHLKEFADGLGTASMMLLPLADLPRLRTDVVAAFQVEAGKDLAQITADIVRLRATRKRGVKLEAYQRVKEDYDKVMRKATEYGRTLQISQDTTAGALELAQEALVQLQADVVASLNSGSI